MTAKELSVALSVKGSRRPPAGVRGALPHHHHYDSCNSTASGRSHAAPPPPPPSNGAARSGARGGGDSTGGDSNAGGGRGDDSAAAYSDARDVSGAGADVLHVDEHAEAVRGARIAAALARGDRVGSDDEVGSVEEHRDGVYSGRDYDGGYEAAASASVASTEHMASARAVHRVMKPYEPHSKPGQRASAGLAQAHAGGHHRDRSFGASFDARSTRGNERPLSQSHAYSTRDYRVDVFAARPASAHLQEAAYRLDAVINEARLGREPGAEGLTASTRLDALLSGSAAEDRAREQARHRERRAASYDDDGDGDIASATAAAVSAAVESAARSAALADNAAMAKSAEGNGPVPSRAPPRRPAAGVVESHSAPPPLSHGAVAVALSVGSGRGGSAAAGVGDGDPSGVGGSRSSVGVSVSSASHATPRLTNPGSTAVVGGGAAVGRRAMRPPPGGVLPAW